jgi:sugar lactone lactonase YvrE/Zn-dependent protease
LTPQIGLRQALLTRGTVLTALLSVAAFSLLWGWKVSLAVVVLLYIHELGHVGAALWRRVPVQRGPLFIPGVGAFVLVSPAARVWDDILISLAGPAVGGIAAFAMVLAGNAAASPALSFGGNIGLLLNLANLLPFSPLDGGRVVGRLGWIGLIPPVVFGASLLATLAFARLASPLLIVIIVLGIVLGIHAARIRRNVTWPARFGILGLYLLVGVALTTFLFLTFLPMSTWAALFTRREGQVVQNPKPVRYDGPLGVAVSADGTLYVVRSGESRVHVLSSGGQELAVWGTTGSDPGQFAEPQAVTLDGSGNVYVGDTGNARVQKLSSRAEPLAQWAKSGAGSGEFVDITAVAVDRSGNVYVADAGDNVIQKVSASGQPLARWGAEGTGSAQLDGPQGVALDAQNHVFVSDTGNDRIVMFSAEGILLKQWGTSGEGAGQFFSPAGIAIDALGNVYVADSGNQRVQKLSADGQPLGQWDVKGDGNFSLPNTIALGTNGVLYVGDPTAHDVRQLAASAMVPPGPAPSIARRNVPKRTSTYQTPQIFPPRPAWAPDVWPLFEWGSIVLIVVAVLDGVVWLFAMRPQRRAATRYVTLALFGWPRLLLHSPRLIAIIGCAAFHTIGLPGLRWLEGLIGRWGRKGDDLAGIASAYGYDCLRRQGKGLEMSWLEGISPVLRASSAELTHKAFAYGIALGPRQPLYAWLVRAMAGLDYRGLSWLAINNLAYSLAMVGRAADGLDLARTAVAAAPESPFPHGTLGEILIVLGSPIEAEAQLRAALAIAENPVNRVALGRALATQKRFAEAVKEAEYALKTHAGPWMDDEPTQAYIVTCIAAWQASAETQSVNTPITA